MADRPYLSKSVLDLQAIFQRSRTDGDELGRLDHELSFRKTQKAQALSLEVDEAIAAIAKSKVASAVGNGFPQRSFDPRPEPAAKLTNVIPLRPAPPGAAASTPPSVAPQSVDLGSLPVYHPSGRKDDPAAIIAAWTALEALSPQSYRRPEDLASGDRSRLVQLAGGVPWGPHAKGKPNYKIYFQVMLGAIALDKATDELVRVFGEEEERSRPDGKKAAIGAILVDKDGYVLEENGVAVSSFAWALKPALALRLGSLGAWPRVERVILEKLDQMVRRRDQENNPVPLDLATITAAHRWLVSQFEVPEHLVEPPTFALKVFHYYKAKNPPEASLLNSFYLEDLATASRLVDSKTAGAGLRRYLGIEKDADRIDVLSPASAVEPFVAPATFPQARWPSEGGHPLVLLQQAAVNAARSEFRNASGIIGINGPPGTGKTTLLRDIVAGCVLDRAVAMAKFDSPMDAFSTTGETLGFGAGAFLHFYRVDASLKGHEIVVASSNNKAVQNVSQELPRKKANGRHDEMAYFRSISDLIANPSNALSNDDDHDISEPTETWGLAAAVLGNGRNRGAFQQTFWWDEDKGFRTYLKAARGDDVLREIKDEATGKVIAREIPSVVTSERPSTNDADAAAAWRKARNAFNKLKKEIDSELLSLEKIRQTCVELPCVRGELRALEARQPSLVEAEAAARRTVEITAETQTQANSRYDRSVKLVDISTKSRPGFLPRLFGTESWKSWDVGHRKVEADRELALKRQHAASAKADEALQGWSVAKDRIEKLYAAVAEKRTRVMRLEEEVRTARLDLGDRMVDEGFFASGHVPMNLTTPWLPDRLHRKREDLFGAALSVHKAFIDAAAKRIYHNLSLVMTAFTAGALQSPTHKALIGDLWSTLFMVVPAVSTTFASVRSMFGDLPSESFGWLLIDEAGQALPQAAIGAVMRAKRSIVVGDPLQIPPVVSLPERLTLEICKFFDVDQGAWAAPVASSQTLADRASRFKSTFRTDDGDREVGLPLLVHRRCQDPMFSVSNTIAYAGQMVHAVGPRQPGAIGAVFGPSRWVDINGNAESKWCPEEGESVVSMLRDLAAEGVMSPDIFIITPFKVIEQEMRRRLETEQELFRDFGVRAGEWVSDRVGTIHTFQGREADTVILLLGAPKSSQHRARVWAGSPPNILNVAVSRAKQNLYVVGSKAAWSGAGRSFQQLIRSLPSS